MVPRFMLEKITRNLRLAFISICCLQFLRAEASVTVSVQPGDQTVSVGEQVVFGSSVTTTAGEVITGFQWAMATNAQSPFNVVGNSAALVLTNVQTSNAGIYMVSVTYGLIGNQQSASSKAVSLAVNLQPQVAVQPASLTLPLGSNAIFSVTVGGAPPLHLQWRKDGSKLLPNSRVTGTTGTALEIQDLALADSGNYDLVLTNSYGSTTSQVAMLQVYVDPPVFTSPTNAVGKQGYPFNFTISATGTAPITFGASGLPNGLNVDSTNGTISGIPSVAGVFSVFLFATNAAQTTVGSLLLTLANDIPGITSATNEAGQQGQPFTYTITATNDAAFFSAAPLPNGLNVDTNSGVVSGAPLVSGTFLISISVSNAYGSDTQTLTLTLASGAPTIISPLAQNGSQGQSLSYTITTHNNSDLFSAAPLPDGLNLNPSSGVISGAPLVSGTFPVLIGAVNQFGSDSKILTFNIGSGVPVITSPLNITNGEEQPNFDYTITASNAPASFWASSLPTGLTVNTNTGEITGSPLYAGNYSIPLFAANVWGAGTATLQLTITNMTITNLVITNVVSSYSSPYLLDFRFSLLDGADPLTSHAVVASPALMSVSAFENGAPVSPSETSILLQQVNSQDSQLANLLQGFLVMDFTESVALGSADTNGNGIPDVVDAEVASAQDFVNAQPAGSQLGVFEFHRDDEAPQEVRPLTMDTNGLDNAIAGIWNNYVQGFPAGSRAWDALSAAITALGPAVTNQTHYILFMSDGQDDSSIATMNSVISAATNANVRIYTVGFGNDVNTNALETLAASTLGQYLAPTNFADLAIAFARVGKDLSSEYRLRWATLNRSTTSFMPTFQITYQGATADSPPNPVYISGTNFVTVTNAGVVITNAVFVYTTNYIIPYYTAPAYAGNVLAGSLVLVTNAYVNPPEITLQAAYVPRYIRQLHLHYRANWPVTVSLDSTNPDQIMYGWTLNQTNDGAGGTWAYLSAPNPTLLADSIPFADFGDLLSFSFQGANAASNAFSSFIVDNTIYTNTANTNFYGFILQGTNAYTAVYALPPPHGTPIPWLISYGFTNNFAADELLDPNGNGLAVWQDYLAGLDPLDPNSIFAVHIAASPGAPQIVFSTVVGRSYRIDWATTMNGDWTVLRDGIAGTGGTVTFTDDRNLSGASTMYYRVVVEAP
ncbi:MAG TPA: putative Ig domain-containing protein [Verrucomicrobiae bacterium]|nr:putative Ig domain-containing protein [Verrucomicrobiae bacterium]